MDKFLIKKAKVAEQEAHMESDESDSSGSHIVSEKKDTIKRKFRKEWLSQFPWLKEQNGNAYCIACEKCMANHITKLKRHTQQSIHVQNVAKKKCQPKLDYFLKEENNTLEKQIRNAEFNLVMFIMAHNLPFILMDYLPHLLAVCCTDSKIAQALRCGRTKSTQLAETLGNEAMKRIISDLRMCKFSLIVDETTDCSAKTCLVLVVRYFEKLSNSICDRFLSLIELSKTDSETIYQTIKTFFQKHNVPLSNLIGLATDGANTMAGEFNGLKTKLKNDTNIFYIKCTCHSLHLCSSYACKQLPAEIEKLCRNIYKYFSHSPKRINEFKEFQDYCGVKPHKILGISLTRWLALESVIARINEQWEALRLYFLSSCLEVSGVSAFELAHSMADPELKVYMLFLSYILKIINNLNKEFQSERVRLPFLYSQIEVHFKLILSNFMHNGFVKSMDCLENFNIHDKTKYVETENIFIGIKAENHIKTDNFMDGQRIRIKTNILKFYIEFLKQIQKRFDFGRVDIKNLCIITPTYVLSETEISIVPLTIDFYHLIKCDIDIIITQWKLLRLLNSNLKPDMDVCVFWEKVSLYKNGMDEKCFQELTDFIYDLLSLPHSSAAAERKFFELSLIKTKLRNKLEFNTINNIMLSKELCAQNSEPHYVWSVKDIGWA